MGKGIEKTVSNRRLATTACCIAVLFGFFFGCGERTGEKEYQKALKSWKKGELSRAQGQMEKALRKLTDPSEKSVANNQLGLILWKLDKKEQAAERFAESCKLSGELTDANLNLSAAYYRLGKLEDASFCLTTLRGEKPQNALVHSLSGLVSMERRDWAKATEQLAEGIRINPSDPAAHNALALAQLHADNNSEKAIERLKQVTRTYPDYAPAFYNLATINDQWLRNRSEAVIWYRQYMQHEKADKARIATAQQALNRLQGNENTTVGSGNSDPRAASASEYIDEGSRLHKSKKYNEAIAQYQLAMRINPNDKIIHYNMGLSLYALKRYDDAAQAYVSALKIDSFDANARYMLSLTYCQLGKWDIAEREARELKKLDNQRGTQLLDYIATERR